MKYVYIAGPYAHPDPVENTHRVIKVADYLGQLGYVPFVPHMTMLWHLVIPHEPAFWYDYDLEWLARCDALLRLPGESWGADREVERAQLLGLPVFHDVNDLINETLREAEAAKEKLAAAPFVVLPERDEPDD